MDELTPITRIESFLDGIVNGSAVPDPITRIEVMLNDIINGNTVSLTPITRIEYFLAIISGANLSIPEPITRIETYLAKIAGEDIETPAPITRIEMYLAQWAEGGTGTIVTVSGTSPLSLVNALAHSIKSLTQYGKCVTSGGDIYCNNGKLMFVSEGIPTDYVRLEYLEADGTQYIDTGITISPQTKYVIKYTPTTGSWIAGYTSGSNGRWGLAYNSSDGIMTLYSDKTSCTMNIPAAYTEAVFDFGVGITYNGQTVNFPTTPTRSTGDFTAYLFRAQGSSAVPGGKINYFAIYEGNSLVQELIPCVRRSDGVLGMYDTVSETFYTNAGTGTFIAGEDVGQVEVVGTPEALTVCGKNLFDKSKPYLNAFVNSITNAISQGSTQWSFCVPCKPNTTYALSGMIGGSSRWGSFTSNAVGTVATAVQSGNGSLTTGANDKWLVGLVFAQSQGGTTYDYRDTLQIEYGSTASEYEAYHEQTVSVADLFAVGDVKDEQDIISGKVIRRTEAVYSDGTITIQALDTPITETVTAQHLSTAEGTNTVSVTSEVGQVELEVEYTQGEVE